MSNTFIQRDLKEIAATYRRFDFPQTVLVETTAYCNIKCVQCANAELKRKKGFMDMRLYKKIVDEIAERAPDTKFWLAFYGEPLLAKYKVYYMLDYAKKKGLTDTYLNTNGMLLTDEIADMLIDAGLDHLIVGIDGFSAEVFESIRCGAQRDTVYDNVLRLAQKLRERGIVKPRIEVQFIVMDTNEHELEQYRHFWASHGVAVKIRGRVTWTGRRSSEGNINNQGRLPCGWGIGICPITWDGEIVACGADCDAEYPFGNITEQSIYEIWNGKKKEFVENHLNYRFDFLPALCKNCNDWQVIGTINFDENGKRYEKFK